jgi:hypothetical protein
LSVAVLVAVMVGVSRVYLGVHWPSDVAAGWALGAAWASLSWLIVHVGGEGCFRPKTDQGAGLHARLLVFIGAGPVSLILSSIFVVVGGAHIWKAVSRKYRDHIEASAEAKRWIDIAAIGGLCARGIIFLIIAFLLFRHGLAGQEGRASLADALDFIAGLPLGAWLLGATGAGFLLFSLYSFSEGIWRRINVEDA